MTSVPPGPSRADPPRADPLRPDPLRPDPSRAGGSPLAVLQRIRRTQRRVAEGERCEMCAVSIAEEHQHLVDLEGRSLLCACRPCYLLFTASGARTRYRAVPDRRLHFEDVRIGPSQWDDLEIPVGLAFLFYHSGIERMMAFYPGPAGATESELRLSAWEALAEDNPGLATLVPDVEALLLRAGSTGSAVDCFLVPIDACYGMVGELRRVWRGFDGGTEARMYLDVFFGELADTSTPAAARPAAFAP